MGLVPSFLITRVELGPVCFQSFPCKHDVTLVLCGCLRIYAGEASQTDILAVMCAIGQESEHVNDGMQDAFFREQIPKCCASIGCFGVLLCGPGPKAGPIVDVPRFREPAFFDDA